MFRKNERELVFSPFKWKNILVTGSAFLVCSTIPLTSLVYSFKVVSFLHIKEAVFWCLNIILGIIVILRGVSLSAIKGFILLWIFVCSCTVAHLIFGKTAAPEDVLVRIVEIFVFVNFGTIAVDVYRSSFWRYVTFLAILGTAWLASILGIAQFYKVVPFLFPTISLDALRLYSVFGNPGLLGGFLACAIPILAAMYFRWNPFSALFFNRLFSFFALLPVSIALILSGTRSAWIASGIGIIFVLFNSETSIKNKMSFLLWLFIGAFIGFVVDYPWLSERFLELLRFEGTGLRARLWFWDGAIRMFLHHPWFGVGPGRFAYYSPIYQGEALASSYGNWHYHNTLHTTYAHSDLLQLLAETGLVGTGIFLAFIVNVLNKPRCLEHAVLITLGTFGLFHFPFHSVPHAVVGLLMCASLIARSTSSNQDAQEPSRVLNYWDRSVYGIVHVGGCLFLLWACFLPSVQQRRADVMFSQHDPNALEAYRSACEHPWALPECRRNFATALLVGGAYEEAEEQLKNCLTRLDTADLYFALGALEERRGNTDNAKQMYEKVIYRAPGLLEAWRRIIPISSESEKEILLKRAERHLPLETIKEFLNVSPKTTLSNKSE